jgi:hypothetical protein
MPLSDAWRGTCGWLRVLSISTKKNSNKKGDPQQWIAQNVED